MDWAVDMVTSNLRLHVKHRYHFSLAFADITVYSIHFVNLLVHKGHMRFKQFAKFYSAKDNQDNNSPNVVPVKVSLHNYCILS